MFHVFLLKILVSARLSRPPHPIGVPEGGRLAGGNLPHLHQPARTLPVALPTILPEQADE